jgi:hypothetical protein
MSRVEHAIAEIGELVAGVGGAEGLAGKGWNNLASLVQQRRALIRAQAPPAPTRPQARDYSALTNQVLDEREGRPA